MKLFLLVFLTFVATLVFGRDASAQRSPPGVECPGSGVLASAEVVADGDQVTFHSELSGGNIDRSTLKYYWTIDRGRIVGGQGTPVIVVDTTGQGPAGSVTVTLQIDPYEFCEWTASASSRVRRKGPLTKADEFWEWFWINSDRILYRYSPYHKGAPDQLDDFRARLREVNPNFTLENPAGKESEYQRHLVIGWAGKVYDAKTVNAFIARAPIMPDWKIYPAKPEP